jgi:hypothetical protein
MDPELLRSTCWILACVLVLMWIDYSLGACVLVLQRRLHGLRLQTRSRLRLSRRMRRSHRS